MRSLRSRLWVLWALTAAASIGVAILLVQLYQQSAKAQAGEAQVVAANACTTISGRYAFYARGWDGGGASFDDPELRRDLTAVVRVALLGTPDIQGGIWESEAGSLAYSGGLLTTLPKADQNAIAEVNREAEQDGQSVTRTSKSSAGQIVLVSCPLEAPLPGMTAWAQTLVPSRASFDRLRLGLALLLFLVLGMSGWLSWLILLWSRHVGRIEGALANHDSETMPVLARTGERDLDRIVDALNEAGNRLADAHRRGEALAARIATSERMAALGRVAAGVAHEIRNPIASMQLKAENALAGDDKRRSEALTGIIGQIARLDTLVSDLLAFTQQRQAVPRDVAVPEFLEERVSEQRHAAEAANVALKIETELTIARFDPDLIARALDNLIANAIRHAGTGGTVTITAAKISNTLSFTVSDTGPGVNPELRDSLFEPFVTGRPDGTGLGLAIAREAAEAHGGRLTLRRFGKDDTGGATFFLEVPWLAS